MRGIIRRLAVLADTWYCIYCGSGYSTYAEKEACVTKCYQERYGK